MAAEGTARPGPTPPPAPEDPFEASEARYRTLVEQVPAVVYVDSNDEHPRSLYVSPQVTEILGIPPARYLENIDHWQQTMHPDDWERVQARWIESIRTGEPFRDEYRFVRPDGEVVWVIDDSRLVHDADGTPLFWHGVLQDITLDKRAEAELRASELRFRALVERTPGVVYEDNLDDERRTLFVSPQVEALFGYTREEWLDQPDIWIELLHPDDREIELAAARPPQRDGRTVEPGVPADRERRTGRVGAGRGEARPRRVGRTRRRGRASCSTSPSQKDLEEQLRRSNDDTGVRRAATHLRARGSERDDVARDRRAPTDRVRAAGDAVSGTGSWSRTSPRSCTSGRYRLGGFARPSNYTSPQIEALVGYPVDEWNDSAAWESVSIPTTGIASWLT